MVWEQKKNSPKLPSMIYAAPHVITVTEAGMAWCAVAATGELIYRERLGGGTFSASPILADGKLYITGDEGETIVLAAGPKFEILARNPLGGKVQASPAIWRDHFIIRGDTHLFCVGQ